MKWRYHLALFPLISTSLIAFGWLAVGRQEGVFARQKEAPRESGDFYDKIAPRQGIIEADLKTGKHEPWESTFYDGSPTLGFARGWIISRGKGYVSTTRRRDMGIVKVEGNRLALVSEAPGNAWGLMPLEYVVVPWDQHVFLVEPDELLTFINDVNSGELRRYNPRGKYLLRIEDFDKKRPTGLPKVPAEYEEYLLRTPIHGNVIAIGEDKEDVAVRGDKRLRSGISLTLNVGKKDGVRSGMKFYAEKDAEESLRLSDFVVISLTQNRCELLQYSREGKARAKVGLRLTTTDYSYDSK